MSAARTAKVARVPRAANDPKPPTLPPVDTWRKLFAYVRGLKRPTAIRKDVLEFVAFMLTKQSGYEDMSSNELWEYVYETTLNGAPKLTLKAARGEVDEWRREWREYNEQEDGPFDMRDDLEEYFS